ncbi:hypothetical protein VPH35_023356 [Triticum aestivum]
MATQMSPLRRWKRFFGAFDSIDAAIEAADPDLCRDFLRRARGDISEGLCNTADDGKAERLCGVLDGLMKKKKKKKKTVEISNKASDLVGGINMAKPKEVTVGQHVIVSADPDAKAMKAAKRKLHERYQQTWDAKRQRRVQLVEAPEMRKQRRERSLAGCATSMRKKTFFASRHQAASQGLAG